MPTIRHPQHYPREYFAILDRVTLKGEKVIVPCADEKAARKLRGHFYAFIGALKRSQAEFPDQFTASQRTMVSLDGSVLTFQSRDNCWQARTIAAALGQASEAPALGSDLASLVIKEE